MRIRWKMAGTMILGVCLTLAAAGVRAQDEPTDRAVSDILKLLEDHKNGKIDPAKLKADLANIVGKVKAQPEQTPPKPMPPVDPPANQVPPVPAPATPPTVPVATDPATTSGTSSITGNVRDKLKTYLINQDQVMSDDIKNSTGKVPDQAERIKNLHDYIDAKVRNKFLPNFKNIVGKDKPDDLDRAEIEKILREVVIPTTAPINNDPATDTSKDKKKPPSNATIFEEVEEVLVDAAEVALAPNPSDIESLVVDSGRLLGGLGLRCAARRQSRIYTTRAYSTRSVIVSPSRSARYILVNP